MASNILLKIAILTATCPCQIMDKIGWKQVACLANRQIVSLFSQIFLLQQKSSNKKNFGAADSDNLVLEQEAS